MSGQVDVLAITQEMRARLVNKRTSPTLIAWANRIDAAVAALIAERDALREVLSEMTELAAGPAGGVSQAQKVAILKKARAALTTGESA